jgi:hypothetical protein
MENYLTVQSQFFTPIHTSTKSFAMASQNISELSHVPDLSKNGMTDKFWRETNGTGQSANTSSVPRSYYS